MSASKEGKARTVGLVRVAWMVLMVDWGGLKLKGLSLVERGTFVAGGGSKASRLSNMFFPSAAIFVGSMCCRNLGGFALFSSTFPLSASTPRLVKRPPVSNAPSLFSVTGDAGKFRDRCGVGFMNDGM